MKINKKKEDKRSEIEKEYDEAVLLLKQESPGSDAYAAQLVVVERLSKLVMAEKEHHKSVSPDMLVSGAVNLLGIGAILGKERLGIISSKALGFVKKIR